MKLALITMLLLTITGLSQEDTLDMDKGPVIMYDFKQHHVPVLHSTEEFARQKREKDSLDLEYAQRQTRPTVFGIIERDSLMIKIYIKGGPCEGFPKEYQLFISLNYWPDRITRISHNQLKEHLTIIKLGERNDTLKQFGSLLEAIEIVPEKDSACVVSIEGRIMNESCSISPLTVRCKSDFKVQKGKELGLSDNQIPDYQFLNKRFLIDQRLIIEYDSTSLRMYFDGDQLIRVHIAKPRSKPIYWFDMNVNGYLRRQMGTYGFKINNLKKTGKTIKLEVHWLENDQTIVIGKFKNLKPIGKWKYYFPDGTLRAEGRYKQFKKQDNFSDQVGKWKYYHPNGVLVAKGKYVLSDDPSIKYTILDNGWEFYDPQGNRVRKRDVVKLYEPKEIVMPLPDYLEEIQFLVNWGPQTGVGM